MTRKPMREMDMSDDKYACCEHCAEDSIHDVPTDGHEIACNTRGPCSTRPGEMDVWTENAALTAEVARLKISLIAHG